MSGALFVRAADLAWLERHPSIVPAADLARLRSLAAGSRAAVYAIPRSTQAEIYVFVGRDDAGLREAVEAFLRQDRRFHGAGIVLPRR